MKKLTCGIPTKDRPIEFSLLLQSLLYQTFQDFDVLVIDDCCDDKLYSNTTIQYLIKLLKESDHEVTILRGEKRGPHISGQKILENSKTELILRLDDDIILRPSFVEELIKVFNTDNKNEIGAVGPIYLNPHEPLKNQVINQQLNDIQLKETGKVFWDNNNNLFLSGYLQNNIYLTDKLISVEHLNSGFMYRKSAGLKIGGYCLDFSPVGHREESDFSYRLFREGYKLFVNTKAISFHGHPFYGGIRETDGKMLDKSNWDHDEKIFLDRMEKILPKPKKDDLVSVIILTHGMHEKLRLLLKDIVTYTNHNCEYIIFNNDTSEESVNDIDLIKNEFNSFKFINSKKILPVSESRNRAVDYTSSQSKYICFIDDDSRILGRYNQTTDIFDFLYNKFNKDPDVGAVGPIYTWFDPLKSHVLSTACLFTSKKVWEIVGSFDPVFGDFSKGTWGYEDTDWSYRVFLRGFKLKGVGISDFPFYHEDTTFKKKSPEIEKALLRGYDLLMSKYNINKIHEYNRTCYPFTKEQMEVQGTKLNVGCYYMKLDGFINIDIKDDVGADIVCNILGLKQHFQDNSISLILASQVFEHLNYEDGKKALKIWHDILKPDGILIVEVPNGDDADKKLANGELTEQDMFTLYNGNPSEYGQKHEIIYTTELLQNVLLEEGFVDLVLNPNKSDSDEFSIRIDCRKGFLE